MYSANNLLENERYKKNISRRKLANGICSPQLLIKATKDDTNIEFLTFKLLLERIGRSPEYLEFILSEKEYSDVLKRNDIENSIFTEDYNNADALLNEYIPDIASTSPVMQMYYYRIQALLNTCGNKPNLVKAQEYILDAIYTTLPGITISNYNKYLFSTYELENILMLCKILCLLGNDKDASFILEEIYKYSLNSIQDSWLRASILPKCAYLISTYCGNYIGSGRIIDYLEQTIDLMRDEGVIYMMEPLLTNLINIYEKNSISEKVTFYVPFRDAIHELLMKYIPNLPQDSIFFRWRRASYNLDTEVFRAERARHHLSQIDLASDVFSDASSLSHFETSKHSLSKSSYKKLAERLDIDKPRRSGFVLTESFDRLQLFLELKSAVSRLDSERAFSLLSELSNLNSHEMQIVNTYKIALRYANAEISNAKFDSATLEQDLITIKNLFTDQQLSDRKPFLEDTYAIIAYLRTASNLSKENTPLIFDKLINAISNSRILPKYAYSCYISIYSNYLMELGQNLSSDEIDQITDNCISVSLASGIGSALSDIIWAQICSLNNRVDANVDLNACKNAVLFASLYKKKSYEYFKEYYEYCLQTQK